MPIKFINEKAWAPMLRDVLWTEDGEPHRSGTFKAQVLEGESQTTSAGPTLDGVVANPWTVRVPMATDQNVLAALVKMGDELTIAPGVILTVQQVTRAMDGYLIIRCTQDMRAPLTD